MEASNDMLDRVFFSSSGVGDRAAGLEAALELHQYLSGRHLGEIANFLCSVAAFKRQGSNDVETAKRIFERFIRPPGNDAALTNDDRVAANNETLNLSATDVEQCHRMLSEGDLMHCFDVVVLRMKQLIAENGVLQGFRLAASKKQAGSDEDRSSPEAVVNKTIVNERATPPRKDSGRKGLISAEFVGDARPPLPILASTMANHAELRRVLRKKMGRKFEVEKMDTTTGLAQGLKVLLRPTLDGLDNSHFSVLEGVPLPALVTDNVGLIVFANDRAWEGLRLQKDPLDTFVLLHMTLSTPKLDFVSDLRSNSLTATLPTGEKLAVTIQNVQLLKSSLHVWTFVQN